MATLSRALDAQRAVLCGEDPAEHGGGSAAPGIHPAGSRTGQPEAASCADQLRQKWPKLAAFIDGSETDVLSHLDFPEQHRTKLHSTDEIDKLQLQTKPRFSVRPRGAVFLSRPGSGSRRAQRWSRVAEGQRAAARYAPCVLGMSSSLGVKVPCAT